MSADSGLTRQHALSIGIEARLPRIFHHRALWLVPVSVAIGWSLWQADLFGHEVVNEGGWELVRRFLRAGLRPELSAEFLMLTVDSALVTLAYAGAATFLVVLIGSIGGVLGSEVWWQAHFEGGRGLFLRGRAPWAFLRGGLAFPRAVHEVIWGLFFINVLGLDPLTAILAIAIPFGAIVAKVFSEILDETDRKPLQALLGGGASPPAAFLYGVVPTAMPQLLSYAFYRFECAIRSAAVLGLIGAGGLGYQILLSQQTLNYGEMWTLIVALIALSGLSDLWSSTVRARLRHSPRGAGSDPVIRGSMLAAAALVVFSFWYLAPEFSRLLGPATMERLQYLSSQAFPPSLGAVSFSRMLELSGRTFAMSVLAMAGAGLLGIVFSFAGSRNFSLRSGGGSRARSRSFLSWSLYGGTRLAFLVGRAVPAPVWALLFLFVLFPGVLPAALALGLYNWGVAGRLMSESIENMDRRPLDGLRAQGATSSQTFLYGALPAALPTAVAYILYRWEVCIRATVIVGLVGAGGLGRLINEQLSSFNYDGVLASLLFLVALTLLVDLFSAGVRTKLRGVAAT